MPASSGLFGTGWQAVGQLRAIALVRTLRQVKVFGRNRRAAGALLRTDARGAGDTGRADGHAEDTVRGSDIVVTITSSATPLFPGDCVEPGTHINAVGANSLARARARRDDDRARFG
jgi:ornithine cyclodeaminase